MQTCSRVYLHYKCDSFGTRSSSKLWVYFPVVIIISVMLRVVDLLIVTTFRMDRVA